MLKKRTPNYTYQWGWNMTYHSLVLQAVRLHPREPVQLHHHFFAVFAGLCMFHSSLNTTHVQPTMLCKRKFTVPWKFSTSISSCPKHSSCNLTSDAYPYEPKAQLNLMIVMRQWYTCISYLKSLMQATRRSPGPWMWLEGTFCPSGPNNFRYIAQCLALTFGDSNWQLASLTMRPRRCSELCSIMWKPCHDQQPQFLKLLTAEFH